jgi:amidohydrolase
MTATSNLTALRERLQDAIEAERDHLVEIAETIRVNPELQFEEFMASQLLADQLREAGFEVEKPYKGLETAFCATRKSAAGDGPTVAIMAEYDALRGIGHGCGHNLIGSSGLAAAIGLGAIIDDVGGKVIIMGTPAEEGGGGKILLLERGAFEGVDAALMIHHGGNRAGAPMQYPDGTYLATSGYTFEFFGKPAHAAADPENGVNALNAVIETFNGVNALRQHTTMDARIHGIVTHGGEAVNVVPPYARCQFGIRAARSDYLDELSAKVLKIAEGAAMMTGCELKVTERETPYSERWPSYVLGRKYHANMEAVGLDLSRPQRGRTWASSDFGNVSKVIPAATGMFAISTEPIPGHSQQVVDASGSEYGYDQFIRVSKAMALTALDILSDPELVKEAKDEQKNWLKLYGG